MDRQTYNLLYNELERLSDAWRAYVKQIHEEGPKLHYSKGARVTDCEESFKKLLRDLLEP